MRGTRCTKKPAVVTGSASTPCRTIGGCSRRQERTPTRHPSFACFWPSMRGSAGRQYRLILENPRHVSLRCLIGSQTESHAHLRAPVGSHTAGTRGGMSFIRPLRGAATSRPRRIPCSACISSRRDFRRRCSRDGARGTLPFGRFSARGMIAPNLCACSISVS